MDKEKKITVPIYVFSMIRFSGFYNRFLHHLKESDTQREAYYRTENEFYKYYGLQRYSCFQTFYNQINFYRRRKLRNEKTNKLHFKFVQGFHKTETKRGRPRRKDNEKRKEK